MSAAAAELSAYLGTLRALVDDALTRALPAGAAPALIVEAGRYPLLAGGKRLRPCLTLAVADAVGDKRGVPAGVARRRALPSACAIEMIHTYSLVHDDLPAMDDDALRRGRPTTHVIYGDGMAVLVGDGLLTEAFAVLAEPPAGLRPSGEEDMTPAMRLDSVAVLARAAGMIGMVGGQAIDLAGAGRVTGQTPPAFDAAALEDMHRRKTGALIRASAMLGAIAAGADGGQRAAVDDYARDLGLAFQIVDDLLDVEGSAETLGKTAGKDAADRKPTFPAIHGLDVSRRLAADCVHRAKAALVSAGLQGRLSDLADWSLTRTH